MPQLQYLQMMAQRFAGTPIGQWFATQAQRMMDAARTAETKWPTMARGPGGQFPVRNLPGDKLPVAPFSRGAAGVAGAGAVAAGSGQFEGVRDRLMPGPRGAEAMPSSLWSELNARGAGAPPMPPAAPPPMRAEDLDGPSTYQREPMRAEDLDGPSTYRPEAAPAPVRRAVQVARSVMPSEPPMPPPRAPMPAPAMAGPSSRELWEIYNQSESPADFARANAAMREGRAEGGGIMEGMPQMPSPDMGAAPKPAGAGAGGSSAAINKALEIIHHLIIRGR